jgi:hypothetical protein
MKLDFIDFIFEGTGDNPRIPHPENAIFVSSAEADRAVQTMKEIIANPEKLTIKWDGEIALFFGRDAQGQFFCSDKYMYPKGILAHSVNDWIAYDKNKKSGTLRPDLYKKLEAIWPGLEQAVGSTVGVFKGDYFTLGQPIKGNYVFRGPTAQYTIPGNTPAGQLLKGKIATVVVHSFDNRPWDGKTGLTNSDKDNVAILNPTLGNTFGLGTYDKQLETLVNTAEKNVKQYGGIVDTFFNQLGTKSARAKLEQWFNQTITHTTQLPIGEWLKQTDSANYKKLIGDNQDGLLYINIKGWNALKLIYNSIYQLKSYLDGVFTKQVGNVRMDILNKDGQVVAPGGEGFVFNSDTQGPIKLVSPGFRQTHFQK